MSSFLKILPFLFLSNCHGGSFIDGYTKQSCINLVPPGHSLSNLQGNKFGPQLTINTQTYSSGKEYTVTLENSFGMKAYMIQGRAKNTMNETAGYFSNTAAELTSFEAKLLNCSAVRDTITNYNPIDKTYKRLSFKWTAPNPEIGEVCLHCSVVENQNFWFKPAEVCLPVGFPATPATPTSAISAIASATALTTQSNLATTTALNTQRVHVQPSKIEATLGSNPTFDCLLLGMPPPTFQDWKRAYEDGTRISIGSQNPHVITNARFSDQGTYECQATGTDGNLLAGSGEMVIKAKPSMTVHPVGATFVLGNQTTNITMSCDGVGGYPLSLSWTRNGITLVGQLGNSLTLLPVTASSGVYECCITNPYGKAKSQSAAITVYVTPHFTTQPKSYDANAGSMALFTCKADGYPKPSIQWVKDGSVLKDSTQDKLDFASVDRSHEGEYWCRATNLVGVVDSNKANLTVVIAPPTFDVSPQTTVVNYGTTLRLTCLTHGYPQPQIQWLKNGVTLPNKTGGLLQIGKVNDGDAGQYSCNATNSIGSTISNAATVAIYKQTPSFVVKPLGARIFAGETHNFTAVARGVPPPKYSWFRFGIAIASATSSYLLIRRATHSDEGIYFCRLTNVVGSTDSTKVYLIVNTSPTTAAPSVKSTEKLTATPEAPSSYQTPKESPSKSSPTAETETEFFTSTIPTQKSDIPRPSSSTVRPTRKSAPSSADRVVYSLLAFVTAIVCLVVLVSC